MDDPQSQESNVDLNQDYISNLPDDLKHQILIKLPIREVARTSILSRKWKDSWVPIPNLVFTEDSTQSKLTKLVDMVLLVHQGPILKFKLVSEHACNDAIRQWMLVLSRNGIQNLVLKFKGGERCVIPSDFFSCVALKDVYLFNCNINVPQFFQGFNQLRTLCLCSFNLSGFSIEKLVSSCPLLDSLKLSNFFQQGCLIVHALNLTFLDLFGEFHDLCLETPKLASATIHLSTIDGDYKELSLGNVRNDSNIIRAIGCLYNIESLDICGEFTEYLGKGHIPEKLPIFFSHLKETFVSIYNSNQDEISGAVCLFCSAPNLKVLHIEFADNECEDVLPVELLWNLKANHDKLFKHLEILNIMFNLQIPESIPLRIAESTLEFAKLVLRRAPVLEKLHLELKYDVAVTFLKKLESFPKLSVKAEFTVSEESDRH
ncbi:F-box/RNI-like/FBD-like domains-containing protein [Rhynchospora pubera]|uniref:F-box/RNI-like/FBD-like domains-containing protein n=1 Tax=Rhynchospora pubera TaxID=906938 RepID=A0AAV8H9H8_9POAL|nr:F-box/RNI-like/FBD-like domains-containing protein [Rhynchospora pubera]